MPQVSTPAVDVLLATHNGERFLEEQLATIKSQSLGDWRLLVSDDASTDQTPSTLQKAANEDERIQLVSDGVPKGGAKENFTYLLGQSSAPYVALCDQDDGWREDKLETAVRTLQEAEEREGADTPALFFSDARLIDADDGVIAPSYFESARWDPSDIGLNRLLAANTVPGCLMVANRALVQATLPLLDDPVVHIHDWPMLLMAQAYGTVVWSPEQLTDYRQHSSNTIGLKRRSVAATALDAIRQVPNTLGQTLAPATFLRSVGYARLIEDAPLGEARREQDARALDAFASMQRHAPLKNLRALESAGITTGDPKRDHVLRYGALGYGIYPTPQD